MKAVLRGLRDYNVNSYTVTLKSNEKKYCVVTISAKDYYTLQSESELMLIVDGMGDVLTCDFRYIDHRKSYIPINNQQSWNLHSSITAPTLKP